MREFAGWIPTVTGKLSFSQVGDDGGQHNAACYNSIANGGSKLYAINLRKSDDDPIPATVKQLIDAGTDRTIFALEARLETGKLPYIKGFNLPPKMTEDSQAMMRGEALLLLEYPRKSPLTQNDILWKELQSLKQTIARRRAKAYFENYENREAGAWLSDLESNQPVSNNLHGQGRLLLRAKFKFWRSGECRIKLNDSDVEHLLKAAPDYNPDELPNAVNALANQLFFCLRDLAHRHYHHTSNADRTGVVYPAENDDVWRRDTQYNLTRLALQARRRNNIGDYKNALGIIAYADTFQKHLAYWVYAADQTSVPMLRRSYVPYDFEAMKTSMEASIRSLEWREQHFNTHVALWIAFTFGLLSVLGVVVNIFPGNFTDREQASGSKEFWSFIVSLLQYPYLLIPILTLPYTLPWIVKTINESKLISLKGPMRFMQALAGAFPKNLDQRIIFFALLALLIAMLSAFSFLAHQMILEIFIAN